ncbi:MAG: right-handed parallel beta-helix repeat-containing protein [Polyangiaceae bacterium]|nr:right-handed parallel beta-helix repeat-containing protein [Polyangiaceae bacterium]
MARHLPWKALGAAAPAIGLLLGASPARAEVIEIGPEGDLIASVAALQPGDELVLRGGTYNLTSLFTIGVSGTAGAPIVIRAKDGEVPVITRPDAGQNTINVANNEYVVLRGLEVVGGSHGIRLDHARFITIEGCHIHDTDDVALSANHTGSSYEGLRILRNHIHDTNNTGEGMYLGCNQNACQMFDSLIEGNWVHNTNGPSVAQGDGIEIKEGSYNNVVRDNVIHDTNYPCILTYSTVGNGGPNVIERNVLWGCGDHGIQSAADAIIRNNIILSAAQDGIRNQPHQSGAPSNLQILHNTILKAQGSAYRASGVVGSLLVANNALYAQSGNAIDVSGDLTQLVVAGNVGVGGVIGASGFDASGAIAADFVAASFSGAPPNDVFPAPGSKLVGAGSAQLVVPDDFNGTPRGGVADAGAYLFNPEGNPGWTITAGFKDSPSGAGGGGAGGSGTGGGGGSGSGAGGGGGSGSGNGGGDGSGDDGGCGCRAAGAEHGEGVWLAAAVAVAAASARRRRRAARNRERF